MRAGQIQMRQEKKVRGKKHRHSGSLQGVLQRRLLRDLRKNKLKYTALGLLILVSLYLVISVLGAAETLIAGEREAQQACRMEDGQFVTFTPLKEEQEAQIRAAGVTLEPHFSMDYPGQDGSVLRIFVNRRDIDRFFPDALPEEASGQSGDDLKEAQSQEGRIFPSDFKDRLAAAGTGAWELTEDTDIFLEKRYAQEHGLSCGDTVEVGGMPFRVAGIGSVPDYNNPIRGMSDSTTDSKSFGVGFVTEAASQALKDTGLGLESETFLYAYRLDGSQAPDDEGLKDLIESFPFETDDVRDPWFRQYLKEARGDSDLLVDLLDTPLLKDQEDMQDLKGMIDPDIHNLQEFVPAEDNMRIGAASADLLVSRYAMSVAGVIIILLFAYVIAVFTMHDIDQKREMIGTLYALGIRRRELTLHFTLLPVIVTGIAGTAGTILGYSRLGIPWQMNDTYVYYSVPDMAPRLVPYILAYGLLMPACMAFLINWFVISRRLDQPVLSLIKGERRQSRGRLLLPAGKRKAGKTKKIRSLGTGMAGIGQKKKALAAERKKAFIRSFRRGQMLRSARPAMTVIAGLFVCLLIAFIGIDVYFMCTHVRVNNVRDTKFEYMYLYKYPEKQVPEGGTEAYARSLTREAWGFQIEVTLMGLKQGNPYFDADVSETSQGRVVITSAMAQKYGLHEGDVFTLKDQEQGRYYAFEIGQIIQYSPAFYVFMDIDAMRDLLGAGEDYYNVVFSDRELPIDSGRLYSTLTRQSIVDASGVFMDMLGSMIWMLISLSAVIFVIVMYLMMGVMVDHSSYDISLMKIFGYRTREIRTLYLSGNFQLIAIGALIAIPLAKMIIDALYPLFISNVACAMDLSMPFWIFVLIYGAAMGCCLLDYLLLTARIKRVVPAQVLKNPE